MKRPDGRETWHRLLEWDKGNAASERLISRLLPSEVFTEIDPSHPLGGPDGGKDILCNRGDVKFVVGCYFARGKQSFSDIAKKFKSDFEGVSKINAKGFIFATNQELSLGQREELKKFIDKDIEIEIFHLERISAMLDKTENYGIRLEYLEIEMTKEEQISFYALTTNQISHLIKLIQDKNKSDEIPTSVETVVPEYIPFASKDESGYISISGFNFINVVSKDFLRKCGYCNYGYRIKGTDAMGMYKPAGEKGISIVTCPKCGSSEEYKTFWDMF